MQGAESSDGCGTSVVVVFRALEYFSKKIYLFCFIHFDVTTSYKLVCRVTLQETALRSARYALTMRASERHAIPSTPGMVSPPKRERQTKIERHASLPLR
ncbi:hypothetical protein EVAR_64495_1 [Eumeta japonica]|uniref:Uncharacterized protein n=1 Tax=Eumeta variegata TaxID=151549 RepID=A0A4C1Z407_EUMVA|nr:hypothetical protein EVAR_64495_1 [Eumeta japonica]